MIPVVFIHFGPCEYADAVIAQARSRGNEVVFLNPPHESLYDHPFAREYEHMSTNHVYFELACMVRWFMLRDWMLTNGVPDCLYCDTDVLLFANVESEIHSDPYYHTHDFTLSVGTSGHTSYWKSAALDEFCHFILDTYRQRNNGTYREIERIFTDMQVQSLNGGVSDMLLLKLFAATDRGDERWRVGEMSVPRKDWVWDHNFNVSDGFVMEDGHKKLDFHNGEWYVQKNEVDGYAPYIGLHSLHMQGQAKQWISQYLSQSQI